MNIQTKPLAAMAPSLRGKVSLVTGSTSGIGLGIARSLAQAGSAIMLNGFGSADDIAQVQSSIETDFGVPVSYSPADMSKPDAIGGMVMETMHDYGRLDIVVNNAGIQHVAPVDQFPIEKWDAILAIDLSSAFHTIRAALPAMRAHNYGRIINIASA
ncbi:MAG: SDR family NAD(P)-dependent oxidoreductase, partial [Pseudomonadota bacterium]